MSNLKASVFLFFASSIIYSVLAGDKANSELQTYIVHVQQPEDAATFSSPEDREAWYRTFLPDTVSSSGEPRILHSYHTAISGFAARLTSDEVKNMETKEGFLQAHPDHHIPLLTTHTPDFLGLHAGNGLWLDSHQGQGVIIGVIDTGITPYHPSFTGEEMPPPPPKWKGVCHLPASACNNKLIGASNFVKDLNGTISKYPIDIVGHGTHTASTAAGSFVKHTAVLGNAAGTASGIAPRAHLAIYKVCLYSGCLTSDIIAGMDAAIKDGVDIMSLSIGGFPNAFHADALAIGAFSAMEKGIFVSFAAGNEGPWNSSVTNGAPWVLTVAAGTTDRTIRSTVTLGNGVKVSGQTLYQPANFSSNKQLPLVLPNGGAYCSSLTLQGVNVTDSAVVCVGSGIYASQAVKLDGGAAVIMTNMEVCDYSTYANLHVLPASQVSYTDGLKIRAYLNSTKYPTATIEFDGTKIDNWQPAPAVACFSSRGPNTPSPGILKPDIMGPGVDVVAAWPFPADATPSNAKKSSFHFNLLRGTSMSTPHLSGVAALIKSVHRDWSPAAIKSAMMTTTDNTGNDGKPIKNERMKAAKLWEMGAGHVNASKAIDPGLVYDVDGRDYIPYLCGLGYSDKQVTSIVKRSIECTEVKKVAEWDLNYPAIVLRVEREKVVIVKREVRNVGGPKEKYVGKVEGLKGVTVKVWPKKLMFEKVGEKKLFNIKISVKGKMGEGTVVEGNLKWISDEHIVRSPILVTIGSKGQNIGAH